MDTETSGAPTGATHAEMSGYAPDGRRIYFHVYGGATDAEMDAVIERALTFAGKLAARGLTVNVVGLGPEEERLLIDTVMKRAKASDGTPIIDFYCAWDGQGDKAYGKFKVHMEYMDPERIEPFLELSGFRSLDDIPQFGDDGVKTGSLERTPGRRNSKETSVPTPFYVVRRRNGTRTITDTRTGEPKEVPDWEFVRFERATDVPAAAAPSNAPPTSPPPAEAPAQPKAQMQRPFTSKWSGEDFTTFWTAAKSAGYKPGADTPALLKLFGADNVQAIKMSIAEAVKIIQQHPKT